MKRCAGSDGQGSSRQAVTLLMSSAPKSAMSLLYFLDAGKHTPLTLWHPQLS